jgi:hypothetical protein
MQKSLILASLLLPTCSWATQRHVLDAIKAKLDSLPGENLDADNQAILRFLKTLPEIASAEIADNAPVVWATLSNGRVVAVVTEPPPANSLYPTGASFFGKPLKQQWKGPGW